MRTHRVRSTTPQKREPPYLIGPAKGISPPGRAAFAIEQMRCSALRRGLLFALPKSNQKAIQNQGSETSFCAGRTIGAVPSLCRYPRRALRVVSAVLRTGHLVDADCISLAAAFCKSHFSLISSHLLSESNPLRFRLIRLLRGAINCTAPLTAKNGYSIALPTEVGAVGTTS